MSKEDDEKVDYLVWINHADKIVSFKEIEGFDIVHFSSYKEKIAFGLDKCYAGYRIQ